MSFRVAWLKALYPCDACRGNGAAGREGSRDRGGEAGTAGAVESENGEGRKEPISLEELLKVSWGDWGDVMRVAVIGVMGAAEGEKW